MELPCQLRRSYHANLDGVTMPTWMVRVDCLSIEYRVETVSLSRWHGVNVSDCTQWGILKTLSVKKVKVLNCVWSVSATRIDQIKWFSVRVWKKMYPQCNNAMWSSYHSNKETMTTQYDIFDVQSRCFLLSFYRGIKSLTSREILIQRGRKGHFWDVQKLQFQKAIPTFTLIRL